MKVLLTTDGMLPARAAENLIARVGVREHLDIAVMTVVPPLPPEIVDDSGRIRDQMWAGAQKAVVETAARLKAAGLQAQTQVAEGHAGEQIVLAVKRDGFELTALGAGSKSWLHQLLLGSTSTFVLHNSPTSVLIAHENLPERAKARVLVGFDASEGSGHGLAIAARFLDPRLCDVKVLTVADEPFPQIDFWPKPVGVHRPFEATEEIRKGRIHEAERRARWAAGEIRDAGFAASGAGDIGHPGVQLLKEAEGGHFDLIVVGSRGLGPVRRTLLGSVSDQVVRHARATLVARREDS